MDVDEAGRDQQAGGVDLLAAGTGLAALDELGDHAIGDGDVGAKRLGAAAVDDRAVTEDEIRFARHGNSDGAQILAWSPGMSSATLSVVLRSSSEACHRI